MMILERSHIMIHTKKPCSNYKYTTLTPQIKVIHRDIYQIYPVVMATGRDMFLIYPTAMAMGYISGYHGN